MHAVHTSVHPLKRILNVYLAHVAVVAAIYYTTTAGNKYVSTCTCTFLAVHALVSLFRTYSL